MTTGTGYLRVSKKHPCGICGKPDWCSFTQDQRIAFCARSTSNADRLSRNGWGIYYSNNKTWHSSCTASTARKQSYLKRTSIAPIERRDNIYRKLVQSTPLPNFNALRSDEGWGIRDQCRELSRYGLYPRTTNDRIELVRELSSLLAKNEPSFSIFKGVPGFWRGSNGIPRLGSDFDFVDDLVLIPFVDSNGLIQACQIRGMNGGSRRSARYLWLSSVRQRDGCGPGTPLHYEGALRFKGQFIGTVLATEGALKAAIVQRFLPDRYVVGNSGVATSHHEIVRSSRGRALEIAFDSDAFTNPHVARSLASLIALRFREQQFLSYEHPTQIISWDKRFKGIDDALIAGASLDYLEISEWLGLLTPECFEEARYQLDGIALGN